MTGPSEAFSGAVGRRPQVAIIGRPNVGKSSLFNRITETRKSVVKDQAGVTRDIVIEPAEFWGRQVDMIDTGGLTEAPDMFSQLIRDQVVDILGSVDFLLVVVDGRAGLIPEDREVIRLAQSAKKPFLLVVNKVDREHELDLRRAEFFEFGSDVISISCERKIGLADVLQWLCDRIPPEESVRERGITLALVGKPNVGKSSLTNHLLGYRRMVVSPVAGTTVDAVDTPLEYGGRNYTLIDTAGLRRSARRVEDVEIVAAFKSQQALERADIVLLMVSGPEGLSDQDAKILALAIDKAKPVVLVANKSDLGKKEREDYRNWFRKHVEDEIRFVPDLPVVFTSAINGQGVPELFRTVEDLWDKLHRRIPTNTLNDFFMRVIRQAPAPVHGTSDVKFYYLTQTQQIPPAFIAFANYPEGVDAGYRRFLSKRLQEEFDLHGVPIRIFVMGRRRRAQEDRA